MSEFVSTHIIEFALAQSDGRVRFIVLTATVDRRAFKLLPHTHTHYFDTYEDFSLLKLVNTKITIIFKYDVV